MIIIVTESTDGIQVTGEGVAISVLEGIFQSGGGGAVDSVNGQTGVVVLDATDVGADASGAATAAQAAAEATAASALTTHAAAANPHPTYLTQAEGDAAYDALGAASTAQAAAISSAATDATTKANAAQAAAVQRANHTGTQSADTLTDGTTNKAFLATERTKLAGIATGATANSSDATLLDRANHTGTQAESTVTNLVTDLAAKAPLSSPTLTGTPAAPTASQGTNTTQLATTAYVQTEAGLLVPKSLVDAKGDLLVGSANDTVARLAVGTDGYILTADAASTNGVKWAAAAAGGAAELLASVSYNPGTVTTYNAATTTDADIDATNLVISFTVPASGRVLVVLTAAGYTDVAAQVQYWTVRESSSTVAGSKAAINSQGARLERFSHRFFISGLTPAASKTWKWGFSCSSGGTSHTRVGDDGSGNMAGPGVMEIWSA